MSHIITNNSFVQAHVSAPGGPQSLHELVLEGGEDLGRLARDLRHSQLHGQTVQLCPTSRSFSAGWR